MNVDMIIPLLIAGLIAGLVNFFVNDINLPFGKSASFTEDQPVSLKDIWWVALSGYIAVGLAGSFLAPLMNALANPLKGLEWTAETVKNPPNINNLLVLMGYGLVFGYSTVKLLVSILDSVTKKINTLDAKLKTNQASNLNFVTMRSLNSGGTDIIDECESQFDQFKGDCSGFVKAVASAFSITLEGQADDIVATIQQADWVQLGHDGVAAKNKADAGWFVIAGLSSANNVPPQDHGHVAIIVSGPLAQNKYPTGYWGKLGGVGEKDKTINWAWNPASRDKVIYAAKQVPVA